MNRAAEITARRSWRAFAVGLALTLAFGAAPAAAQTDDAADAADAAMTKKERKQAAKDARIREYLRKKEERRLMRDQRRADGGERRTATPSATASAADAKPARAAARPRRSSLPRGLAQAQANVRASSLGDDATVQSYLALIDAQQASPYQLAAFGNFVAQSGLGQDALAYYDVALRIERDDPTLWINYGTLHRQRGDTGAAGAAFGRALRIDPNNAVAHYNLGAIFDQTGRYEDAIAAFKTALTLDPSLGDPASNPQAANNERLLAVKLLLYQEQSGSVGLPLQAIDPNRNGNGLR